MKKIGLWAVILASWNCVTPPVGRAAEPFPTTASTVSTVKPAPIRDIALRNGGVLQGKVINEQGAGRPDVSVAVLRANGQTVGQARTNDAGEFQVATLSTGVYQVVTDQSGGVYRIWSQEVAPPAANDTLTLNDPGYTVRGQLDSPPGMRWLASPWVLGLGVAAAIAIPLSVGASDGS